MNEYRVLYVRSAKRELDKLPRDIAAKIAEAVVHLKDDPRPIGSIKLKGTSVGDYRLRVGDYRVIYDVDDEAKAVIVVRVQHRREVYR
ncbi:MAG: translation repressor RelE [Chloroflexota bacterium]|nr:MAG: translation repressor RelE [Chloroflexota bacterium]